MRFELLSLALAGLATAADTCTDDVTITELTKQFDCEVVEGLVSVSEELNGKLVISGAKQFKGGFNVSGVTNLLGIESDSLNSIGGDFLLQDLNLLTSLKFTALKSINKLTMRRLKIISGLTFGGSGVSNATDVEINDCGALNDLTGLQITTVNNLKIINNPSLTKFDSSLVTINETLILTGNGDSFNVKMSDLETAFDIQVSDVKSFEVPALETIGSALRFENNSMIESFEAKNLTLVGKNEKDGGSLSFNNNKALNNLSFPVLEKINGDLTIVNNTNLTELSGFPELTDVYGALLLGGSFEEIDLPKVKSYGGAVTVKSSANISDDDFCSFLDNAKVAGKKSCEANLDEKDANSKDGKGGDKKGSDDGDSGAATFQLSTAAMGLTFFAAVAQLL
ncbi:cell wall protein Ecm33 [Lecanicillium sp. MT-2017a]|nr:cell wall protein Ecm33 [Lecanicillium sp. MT-2017a]